MPPDPDPTDDVSVTQHIVDDLAEVAEPLVREADARLRLRWLINDS